MKYFIIIDMQNDFVDGSLANPAAKAIVPAIAAKAKELKEKGYTIIATRDTHQKNYMSTQEGKNLPVEHCIELTHGWDIVEEIEPLAEVKVNKPSFGFGGWKMFFDMLCEDDMPEAIEICGTVTEICVSSNFATLKATFPEVPITVHKDLCAGLSEEGHNAALTVMKAQQAIIC